MSVLLQVKPAADLNPCLSSSDEVANKLKSFVLGEGNPLDGFLNKGELSQAAQISLSVIRSANEKNDCGKTLDPDVKKLVRSPLCKKIKLIPGFCSIKWLGVFLLLLDGVLVHRRSFPSNLLGFPNNLPV